MTISDVSPERGLVQALPAASLFWFLVSRESVSIQEEAESTTWKTRALSDGFQTPCDSLLLGEE
jgi:hypothetical protein